MRKSFSAAGLVLVLFSLAARAETQQLGTNLFLAGNDQLFARGNDGVFRAFSLSNNGNLLFGGFQVSNNSAIVDQILDFYCQNLNRPLSSSLRFNFFVQAISLR